MDDLKIKKYDNGSYNDYQGYRSRTPTAGNMYESGLPDNRRSRPGDSSRPYHSPLGNSRSRLVDGKEHKILKDQEGTEVCTRLTYILFVTSK